MPFRFIVNSYKGYLKPMGVHIISFLKSVFFYVETYSTVQKLISDDTEWCNRIQKCF